MRSPGPRFSVVPLVPVCRNDRAQPSRRRGGHGVQGRPHRLGKQLEPVQRADSGQDVRAVGALPTAGLQQPTVTGHVQETGEQTLAGLVFEQAGPELAQDRKVEAGIRKIESEQVLPVNPASHRVGGAPVAQPFPELHQCDECEAPGRVGWLTQLRVEVGEIGIGEQGAEPVAQEHVGGAAPESGLRDPSGVLRDRRQWLRTERHGRPPDWKPSQRPTGRPRSLRQQCRARYGAARLGTNYQLKLIHQSARITSHLLHRHTIGQVVRGKRIGDE